MAKKDQLFTDARSLPASQRAELLHALAVSLEDEPADDPAIVEAEWDSEIVRRAEELRSGKVKGTDGMDLIRGAREDLRRKHGV